MTVNGRHHALPRHRPRGRRLNWPGREYTVQRTLLVPLDGSEVSEASLPWATKLAQEHGLSLTLARVVEYPHFGGGAWPEESMSVETYEQVLVVEEEEAGAYLESVQQRLAETGLHVETSVRHGNPSVALLDLADELGARAIVISSHGRGGFKRFVLGSVAMQLVSHTAVPVFLVHAAMARDRRPPSLDRLLVPLDGSVLAERALDVACEVAAPESTLVLVRVVPWPTSFVVDGGAERVRDAEATAYGVTIATSYLDRVAASLREAGVAVETQVDRQRDEGHGQPPPGGGGSVLQHGCDRHVHAWTRRRHRLAAGECRRRGRPKR